MKQRKSRGNKSGLPTAVVPGTDLFLCAADTHVLPRVASGIAAVGVDAGWEWLLVPAKGWWRSRAEIPSAVIVNRGVIAPRKTEMRETQRQEVRCREATDGHIIAAYTNGVRFSGPRDIHRRHRRFQQLNDEPRLGEVADDARQDSLRKRSRIRRQRWIPDQSQAAICEF